MRRELRIGPSYCTPVGLFDQYQLRVMLAWRYETMPPASSARQESVQILQGGVDDIARTLAQFAASHALTVGVSDNRQHVVLSRT